MKFKVIETNYNQNKLWEEREIESSNINEAMNLLLVFSELERHSIKGFGGAFTESSAYNYSLLNKENQDSFIKDYFSQAGLNYNLGRIHMNSCDFSLNNYTYIEENDNELKTFDISHDEKLIIPFIKKAMAENSLEFLMSPWSPSPFMKNNNEMNNGGKLLDDYYDLWADYYLKFIEEYQKVGININNLTIQNEPEAKQTWDSCLYSAEEELKLARLIKKKLKEKGLNTKIYGWDHNKENLIARAKGLIKDDTFDGLAVHWYTGDHFENIEICQDLYPQLDLIFSEGCVEYSRFEKDDAISHANMYAHDMIGNFKAGISSFYDWNLLLDEQGGPNHVGNYCESLIMLEKNSYRKNLTYYYVGHLSKYVKENAKVLASSIYTSDLETISFKNPDGKIVVVVLNKFEKDQELNIKIESEVINLKIQGQSIVTICQN